MRVKYAKITASHGLKGLAKMLVFGEDASLLSCEIPLYTSETGDETLGITLKNPLGKYVLVAIDGVNDRNGSDAIKGTEIWVDKAALPEINDDEFYVSDLIGLAAVDQSGKALGKVIDFANYGAGDLLDIALSNGEEIMVPFNKDETGDITDYSIVILTPEKWMIE